MVFYPRWKFDSIIAQVPLIYIPYEARKWLEDWLKPEYHGLEFGSGMSTIWLAQRVKSLISVEHDEKWVKVVETLIEKYDIKNVNLVFEPNLAMYYNIVKTNKKDFDFLFIDGKARYGSTKNYYTKVRKDGIVIIDNTDAIDLDYEAAYWFMNAQRNWERIDFKGRGINPKKGEETGPWQTSIWTRKS